MIVMIYDDQSETSWAPQPDGDGARPEDGSGQSRPRSAGVVSPSQITAASTAAAAGGGRGATESPLSRTILVCWKCPNGTVLDEYEGTLLC